jgi:hypothetical protein
MPSKTAKPALTPARLRELLIYDENEGVFRWKDVSQSGRRSFGGRIAGRRQSTGYVQIGIDGRLYLAHRLAFFWMMDRWPEGYIDHRDRDRTNNRWHNLRDVSPSANNINRSSGKVEYAAGITLGW